MSSFAVGSSLCILLRATLVAVTGLWTAQKLFTNMLHSVFRAPMSFFDSTPTGRILNRASSDQSVLDLEIAMKLGWCAFSIIQLLGTITVMSQVAWEVFVLFIPVTAVCIWYQRYYTPTARELARISGIQRTPILHHFAESLAGAATIRAFNQEERFTRVNLELIDGHSRPWFHNASAMEWLSFRLNILSNIVFAFSLALLVTLPEGIINPSIAGLAVTYGINLNAQQAITALVIEDCRPPINWPSTGTISFRNLQIRYAEHLPSVLKNITCTFPGRKKIGVVGRTGSGKSTLIQAIFRIIEPREGSIEIDDVDICKIGLHDLRSRLSIIPQDPTMFEGTVRGNLDPLEQYSDTEIWEALDKCQLGDVVRAKEQKLDYTVVGKRGEIGASDNGNCSASGETLLKEKQNPRSRRSYSLSRHCNRWSHTEDHQPGIPGPDRCHNRSQDSYSHRQRPRLGSQRWKNRGVRLPFEATRKRGLVLLQAHKRVFREIPELQHPITIKPAADSPLRLEPNATKANEMP
ncbi:hypothetical protein MLD38_019160 [Melastoma candidum]|uniref:Uncharacterized protein n=1 Tax=Melastoma candidum TaxID=119954 RepID=A0ACB9QWA6_9MYRT|nr:hypothetical protein MLD38_019160 [Melastoma candidum]